MQSFLLESVCKTGIFILCAQMLIQFRPKASFEKYLKMLVSVMVLMQLFAPVAEVVLGGHSADWSAKISSFEQVLSDKMKALNRNAAAWEGMVQESVANPDEAEENAHDASEVSRVQKISVGEIKVRIGEGVGTDATD